MFGSRIKQRPSLGSGTRQGQVWAELLDSSREGQCGHSFEEGRKGGRVPKESRLKDDQQHKVMEDAEGEGAYTKEGV